MKKRKREDRIIRREVSINQVHVRSGDGWREGWSNERHSKNQLIKFTYGLEIDKEKEMGDRMRGNQTINLVHVPPGDGWKRGDRIRGIKKINQIHVRPGEEWWGREGRSDERYSNYSNSRTIWWRMKRKDGIISWEVFLRMTKFTYRLGRMKRKERNDQLRGLKTINQVHVLPGDGWRCDRMIRCEVYKQLSHILSGNGWRWDMIRRYSKINQVPYSLETVGWDDEMKSIKNLTNSRTFWRQMKRMRWKDQMWGLKTIVNVHVRTGDRWRGCDRMVRSEVFVQIDPKFTYSLMTDEDGTGWSDERYPNNLTKFTYKLETDEEDEIGW